MCWKHFPKKIKHLLLLNFTSKLRQALKVKFYMNYWQYWLRKKNTEKNFPERVNQCMISGIAIPGNINIADADAVILIADSVVEILITDVVADIVNVDAVADINNADADVSIAVVIRKNSMKQNKWFNKQNWKSQLYKVGIFFYKKRCELLNNPGSQRNRK